MLKKILIGIAFVVAAYLGSGNFPMPQGPAPLQRTVGTDAAIDDAFEHRRDGVLVEGAGTVHKVLRDDSEGSRHQRFILTLPSGHTVLVAHNIDIAGRIEGLAPGDAVRFKGEYAWNPQGGVVHWTHHDPAGSHAVGWLEHAGRRYQ
jgi:Protein of unknown function (DUF3465)